MLTIDDHALNLANRALSVIFIILIVAINGGLIGKLAKKPKFFLSPKFMLLISLAIGDIINALFSLVVYALLFFGHEQSACSTQVTSGVYNNYVISFAYGVGVTLLAIELVVRHQRKNTFSSPKEALIAFIFSFVPWFLVLIFVLPLTMADINWETCSYRFESTTKFQAVYSLCDIVPQVIAVIVCFITLFLKLTPKSDNANVHVDRAGVVIATASGVGSGQVMYNYPPQQAAYQQHLTPTTQPEKTMYPPQTQSNNQGLLPGNHRPHQPYQPYQPQVYVPVTQPSTFNNTALTNPNREKNILLIVAFATLICVMPYGAFAVSDKIISIYTVLFYTFFWLLNFRSILTPLIWLIVA